MITFARRWPGGLRGIAAHPRSSPYECCTRQCLVTLAANPVTPMITDPTTLAVRVPGPSGVEPARIPATATMPAAPGWNLPAFRAPYAPPDEALAAEFLKEAPQPADAEARIDARAGRLVGAIRARTGGVGGIEDFLHEYTLSTREGLALMVLAEALLRVPDAATADRLIEDKLGAGDFAGHEVRSPGFLISASAWALGISARLVGFPRDARRHSPRTG